MEDTTKKPGPSAARRLVVRTLTAAAHRFPQLVPIPIHTESLSPPDANLALAIHRTCLQRWITIEHVLDLFLSQPMRHLEPSMRSVLLSGGAQLLFLDRLPRHAVVHESVDLARRMVRPRAGSMVNAVLRRVAQLVGATTKQDWIPRADRLPLPGGVVELSTPCLPEPNLLEAHLSIATSHRRGLVSRWIEAYGQDRATSLCRHGVRQPPILVANEGHFNPWTDSHEKLVRFLSTDPRRRVQDPATARPIEATSHLRPKTIIDYCAGRGTKTRQLLELHPQAHIHACDVDRQRLKDLSLVFNQTGQVNVTDPSQLPDAADLVVLDVPCTNTGVLARRPEARYRFDRRSLSALVKLQRNILIAAIPRVTATGYLLYCTCSLEHEENQDQTRWIMDQSGARLIEEAQTLPPPHDHLYHDGGYYALLQK